MSEYIQFLQDVFALFGPIQARKMFGGYGIFYRGIMFGLVSEEKLYLKADAINAEMFLREGLDQFEYQKGGKPVRMSYYEAPESLLEDPEQAAMWARQSYEAALRSGKSLGRPKKIKDPG